MSDETPPSPTKKPAPLLANEVFRAVSYFSNLENASLDRLISASIRRSYSTNQVLLIEGDPCAGMYIIESGWLKAVKIGSDGREQVLQTLSASDAFNAISVFTGVPNQATVSVLEDAVVWLIPRAVLLRLLDEHPPLARKVTIDLAEQIMRLVQMVEDLSLRPVESRLARLLLEQAQDGSVQRRRWATQAELASRLGTVPDVVNRALRKLSEEGLIQVDRHQIRLLDLEGLQAKTDKSR